MLYLLLLTIIILQVAMLVGIYNLRSDVDKVDRRVEKLRLTRRTRQNKAVMRDGAVSPERQLVRLGRASKGRRVVVGGDPDSQLALDLWKGVPHDDDGE